MSDQDSPQDIIIDSLQEIAREVGEVPDISEIRNHFERFAKILQQYLFPDAEVVFRPYVDNSVNRDATSWYISVRFTSLKPDFLFEENICSIFIPINRYPVMINAAGSRYRIMNAAELETVTLDMIQSSSVKDTLKRYTRNILMLAQFKPEG
ncbi:MAG: hypothetical protein WC708_01105 [Lentisphaeria bacterium]|jgi:hypothetical protein